ncbi:MAG: T9SS type A sorting domain-containing protein, partial [Bacteroidota bacterium]|nr:T9SS type A sorting domain-containing protein [Bacteroidota bacterium]MDX5430002.1 T9SS type A sorting domain-containing protein [Bacteroidota bacterium]MDX5468775.1 T9SS type A sorting domain-containing protein [Bacteroidota bacterium]
NLTNANIDMIAGSNPGGPGFIGGNVTQGANKKNKPLDGIQVLLLTDQDIPVASQFTHDGGQYKFEDLTLGKYKVMVEIPGKTSSVFFVILTEDQIGVEERNFEVNSTYISTLNSLQTMNKAPSRIYPNPAGKELFIEWTEFADENIQIGFYAIDGQLIQTIPIQRMGEMYSHISVEDLPKGFYILRIHGDSSLSTLRLQKN